MQLMLFLIFLPSSLALAQSQSNFTPKSLHRGTVPTIPTDAYHEFTLDEHHPHATLDYGAHVAGLPSVQIAALSGPVQVEVKYSEQFSGLLEPLADGPSTLVSSLANSYRVETFNITQCGQVQSSLTQGGQRWQAIRLITNGTVAFQSVGFKPTVQLDDLSRLPGQFKSSNSRYNEIWKLGARAVSLACFDEGSQPSIWNVSSDGALVSSSVPSYSTSAWNFANYTLEFDAQIVRGGLQWSMGYNFGIRSQGGILLNLAGNYPVESTFANTNKTLFPPSTVSLGYGIAFVNQTTISSYALDTFSVPFEVREGVWHHIRSTIHSGSLSVSINDHPVFNVPLSDYYIGGGSISTSGTFGFGAWQDQSGLIRNVAAHDGTGKQIYSNAMTNASQVLPEYGVHENYYSTCVDGARRDRLAWLGDFIHTVRILSVSTGRIDQIRGTFEQLFAFQLPSGQLPMAPSLGYSPDTDATAFALGGSLGLSLYLLPDYHILGLISVVSYMESWNDVDFAKKHWSTLSSAVDWLSSQRSNTTSLVDFSRYVTAFLGPVNGIAVNAAAVQAFKGMSMVASAVGDNSSASKWASIATSLKTAINTRLWNGTLGVYSLATSQPSDFSIAGTAFSLSSGIANKTQALASISHLASLQLGPGYKDASTVSSNDPTANISPNTNGFLLPVLMEHGKANETRFLLDNLWGAMLSNESTFSGASWEYVSQQRSPGLGQYTSLSHPWGGAATYILSQRVAGIRPVEFGYKTWIVEPAYTGFDLDHVESTVPTPHGDFTVSWSVKDSLFTIRVDAPAGTNGHVVLRKHWACPDLNGSGKCRGMGDFVREVTGGSPIQFEVEIPWVNLQKMFS
ncbi:hypothetical protein ASPWEDRAFT_169838 [Aspergillus wentii DTO 134E9]|uniref:Alpha-L-rhamnosidase C-terminal domain-containing protein n=1 Tax=Aspergillus wentii DTO 134E9 TaxID=1073089 RepID=A0A1L9RMY4_ASPWE|nr:uncharacterized protein ASPWEDRAFT_169838 [Aspergillus wentii DTO 134E9]OJJ36310.1 hypothetical protein ASPWEDRAFT_169838 [Aspergillus wentii DTO 134E9]